MYSYNSDWAIQFTFIPKGAPLMTKFNMNNAITTTTYYNTLNKAFYQIFIRN